MWFEIVYAKNSTRALLHTQHHNPRVEGGESLEGWEWLPYNLLIFFCTRGSLVELKRCLCFSVGSANNSCALGKSLWPLWAPPNFSICIMKTLNLVTWFLYIFENSITSSECPDTHRRVPVAPLQAPGCRRSLFMWLNRLQIQTFIFLIDPQQNLRKCNFYF